MTEFTPHIKVTWAKVYPEEVYAKEEVPPKERKEMIEEFSLGSNPMSAMEEPASTSVHSEVKARRKAIKAIQVKFPEKPNAENAQKRKGLVNSLKKLGRFIKNHPWLTAGFIIALILATVSAFLTINALMGHTTIPIFHAHPELGGGLTFMTVYYSVYLINLCRRAAVKDDLEARIHAHNEFTEELMGAESLDIEKLTSKMNTEIEELSKKYEKTEKTLRELDTAIKAELKNARAMGERLEVYKARLKILIEKFATKMPEGTKEVLWSALDKTTQAIKEGAALMHTSEFPTIEEVPDIPVLEITGDRIEIPGLLTETMKANQLKQRAFTKKVTDLFKEIGTFPKKNPGSTALIAGGLMMCALAGVAVGFYLHGASNVYFFGTISALTILPMGIYGLSLIYEGYNSSTINALTETLEEVEESNIKRREALEEERKRLSTIEKRASTTFKEFTSSWTEFVELETRSINEDIKRLRTPTSSTSVVEAEVRGILKSVAPFFPDTSSEETLRVIKGYEEGTTV